MALHQNKDTALELQNIMGSASSCDLRKKGAELLVQLRQAAELNDVTIMQAGHKLQEDIQRLNALHATQSDANKMMREIQDALHAMQLAAASEETPEAGISEEVKSESDPDADLEVAPQPDALTAHTGLAAALRVPLPPVVAEYIAQAGAKSTGGQANKASKPSKTIPGRKNAFGWEHRSSETGNEAGESWKHFGAPPLDLGMLKRSEEKGGVPSMSKPANERAARYQVAPHTLVRRSDGPGVLGVAYAHSELFNGLANAKSTRLSQPDMTPTHGPPFKLEQQLEYFRSLADEAMRLLLADLVRKEVDSLGPEFKDNPGKGFMAAP
ncbi:hypothetical protein WJX73_007812 [Symbiochloris irregularis]|uniref:Uncharacterized protein n=1 Tax=Symbiochloris irregularis TaxID=706552 RepID=A0AAW1P1K0_9CHLO